METFNDEILSRMEQNRPKFPLRAVVTAGMPYGNKELHYGHACGTFVYADFLARFLRDRIGSDNVIFVSGTDCFGSPSLETYRKMVENGYKGTIEDMVASYHAKHKNTLKNYEMSMNLFGASSLGKCFEIHKQVSEDIFMKLYQNKVLSKLSTLQFYDEKQHTFLNGRQVVGKCPIEGCQSERGYADECSLGHQYLPKDLIDPVSTLSGERPVLKECTNWYFNLQDNIDLLKDWLIRAKSDGIRDFVVRESSEFLKKPELYIKQELKPSFEAIKAQINYSSINDENKNSFTVIFDKLEDRENACKVLHDHDIRFRTGKTLVPFRMSGNISWGVPVPVLEGEKDLTFYCWPESLWAPISFTQTYLDSLGKRDTWKDWWCSKDSYIYQILGEDNMFFYGLAQHAMWFNTQNGTPKCDPDNGDLQPSHLVVNKYSAFMGAKASSSGAIKPPMADDLLNYYTAEQLRAHFLGFNVGNASPSFNPKPYNKDAKKEDVDPVLKEGNLLTNVYNKILRTLCYTWQKHFDGIIPNGKVSEEVSKACVRTILKYEKLAFETKFHMITYELDSFIRSINKYWLSNADEGDKEKLKQAIIDTLHQCKVAMVLLHPIAPSSTENLAKFLHLDSSVFSWDNIEKPIYDFVLDGTKKYRPEFLEPKQDFFKKHPSQFES